MELIEINSNLINNFGKRFPNILSNTKYLDDGSISIEIPLPKIPTVSLKITTQNHEITLGFIMWHIHGDMLGGKTIDEQIANSLDYIKLIIEDKIKLVLLYKSNVLIDLYPTDDPDFELSNIEMDETVIINTWSLIQPNKE